MSERLDTRFRQLMLLREANDMAQRAAADAKRAKDTFESELWAELEDEGITTITADLGEPYGRRRFQRKETLKARSVDERALVAELERRGLSHEILKQATRQKVLSQYVRTLTEHGKPLPEGVELVSTKYISSTSL